MEELASIRGQQTTQGPPAATAAQSEGTDKKTVVSHFIMSFKAASSLHTVQSIHDDAEGSNCDKGVHVCHCNQLTCLHPT